MSIAAAMLAEFEQEAKTTRKFLEQLPEDKLLWKPHDKSMTAVYPWLDRAPKGRNETRIWWRHHDAYENA